MTDRPEFLPLTLPATEAEGRAWERMSRAALDVQVENTGLAKFDEGEFNRRVFAALADELVSAEPNERAALAWAITSIFKTTLQPLSNQVQLQ